MTIRFLPVLAALSLLLTGCGGRQFDKCTPENTFGEWGVLSESQIFGERADKDFFLVNPIGMVTDSIFYNANYTDSYFAKDSTRIVLQYIPSDSLKFHLARLYAVEVNPDEMLVKARVVGDTAKQDVCEFYIRRLDASDHFYGARADSAFVSLMEQEKPIDIRITNTRKSVGSEGNQLYRYRLYCAGFKEALARCRKLNHPAMDSLVRDSVSHHEKLHKK